MPKLKTHEIAELSRIVQRDIGTELDLNDGQLKKVDDAIKTNLSQFVVPDTKVYLIAVIAIAAAVLISVISAAMLAFKAIDIPEVISVIAGAAIGALAGMITQR